MSLLNTDPLLERIREGRRLTRRDQLWLTVGLSLPAIVAQVAGVLLQYIDAAMVGHLGAEASASIGLVSTSIWMLGGLCGAVATGFTVQVAHRVGANDMEGARDVLRQATLVGAAVGMLFSAVGIAIHGALPAWLGGEEAICADASAYFLIYSVAVPFLLLSHMGSGMLRCAGNVRVPSVAAVVMCVLDVCFNYLFIYACGWGVAGAAWGTFTAELLTAACVWWYIARRSPELRGFWRPAAAARAPSPFALTGFTLRRAWAIGSPIGLERVVTTSAQIVTTMILAPLGAAAIAAHSFGITIEALCYMPGYGIEEAATTLGGQSIGARRYELTKRFAWLCVGLGVGVMTVMGAVMWVGAPAMMSFITPVEEVIALGTEALRIEAWAEPGFAAAIVCYGCMVGAGDTFIPACLNFGSMWLIRITLALLLTNYFGLGLRGVWIAMAVELCLRGLFFLIRLRWGRWMKPKSDARA